MGFPKLTVFLASSEDEASAVKVNACVEAFSLASGAIVTTDIFTSPVTLKLEIVRRQNGNTECMSEELQCRLN